MKNVVRTIVCVLTLSSACMLFVHADGKSAMTIPGLKSAGIVESSDGSVCLDSEDIKNLRMAVNSNAALLDDVSGNLQALSNMISAPFSENELYEVGDIVTYCDLLYILRNEENAGIPGKASGWEPISISQAIGELLNRQQFNVESEKQEGEYNTDGSDLYKITITGR